MVDVGALSTQLRKGVIEYSILALLAKKQLYAVEVLAELAKYPGLAISEGTVYPVLNRLKREGLVHYDWSESPIGPPRKHYRLSPEGEEALAAFRTQWDLFVEGMRAVLDPEGA